jgi:hypothetical protein
MRWAGRNPPGRIGGAAGQLGEVLVVSVDEPQLGVDLAQSGADGGEVTSSVIVRPDAEIPQVHDERPLLAGQDSVTLAPSVPDDKAWMSHSCSWDDMAGTFTP